MKESLILEQYQTFSNFMQQSLISVIRIKIRRAYKMIYAVRILQSTLCFYICILSYTMRLFIIRGKKLKKRSKTKWYSNLKHVQWDMQYENRHPTFWSLKLQLEKSYFEYIPNLMCSILRLDNFNYIVHQLKFIAPRSAPLCNSHFIFCN